MTEYRFQELRRALQSARMDLEVAIAQACPGPHQYTQHRDGKPPWCNVCGFTGEGYDHSRLARLR
jgi:hypothetical protein